MPPTKRTIGIYGVAHLEVLHRSLAGVLRYAEDTGGFTVRDFRIPSTKDTGGQAPPPWRRQVDGVVTFLGRFDGATDKQTADWVLSGGVPAVSVGADWKDPRVPCVHVETESLAKLAASHLVECGCASFLYAGFARSSGSPGRGQAFQEALAEHGRKLVQHAITQRMDGSAGEADAMRRETELRNLLLNLKKPLGVWALNDDFASGVCVLCEDLGLAIPGDVKVLGVGDFSIARNHEPALSSIRTPGEQIGYLAMRTLHALIEGRRARRKETAIPATELVARDSTLSEIPASTDIQEAVDYIARHACSGVSVPHLAQRMRISRRSFELKFQEFVGHSPGDEIRRVRLERAQELLRQTQISIFRISSMVGFQETPAFCTFFLKHTGQTPTEYRAAPPGKGKNCAERSVNQ